METDIKVKRINWLVLVLIMNELELIVLLGLFHYTIPEPYINKL